MGRLQSLRVYNAGAMQYCPTNGKGWREYLTPILEDEFGLVVINPTDKPDCYPSAIEDETTHLKLKELLNNGEYEKIKEEYSQIRTIDLRFCDIVDFLIINIDLNHYSFGTLEEFYIANKSKKPCLIRIEQGKQNCPYWVFWTIPHEFIFSTWDELLDYLRKVDSGEDTRHFRRWKFVDLGPQTLRSLIKASEHDERLKDILDDYVKKEIYASNIQELAYRGFNLDVSHLRDCS